MSEGTIRVGIGGWTYRAMARGLLSRRPAAEARTRICVAAAGAIEINATFYCAPEPEELGNLGERCARRLPVRGQGLALLRDPPEAGRRRRRHRQFLRAGPVGAWAEARPDAVDARARPQVRSRGYRRVSSSCSRASWTAFRSAMSSSRATKASATRPSSTFAASMMSRSCTATTTNSPASTPTPPDFAYARLQRMSEEVPTGYDDAALDASPSARRSGEGWRDAYVFMINGAKVRAPRRRAAAAAGSGLR